MARLFKYSNIIFEITLYLLICGSYFNWDNMILFFITLFVVISTLISGLPSAYYQLGYETSKRLIDLDGLFKIIQLIILFGLMPVIGNKYISMAITLLSLITIGGIYNRFVIYKQIRSENIKFSDIIHKMQDQTVQDRKVGELISMAWRTVVPFFLIGLLDDTNKPIKIIVFLIIMFWEIIILRRFYLKLVEYNLHDSTGKDFFRLCIKLSLYMVFLVIMVILNPTGFFIFVIAGFYTSELVNFANSRKFA